MKRIWFNPNIVLPNDGEKYYVRFIQNEITPHYCAYDLTTDSWLDDLTGLYIQNIFALRCSHV